MGKNSLFLISNQNFLCNLSVASCPFAVNLVWCCLLCSSPLRWLHPIFSLLALGQASLAPPASPHRLCTWPLAISAAIIWTCSSPCSLLGSSNWNQRGLMRALGSTSLTKLDRNFLFWTSCPSLCKHVASPLPSLILPFLLQRAFLLFPQTPISLPQAHVNTRAFLLLYPQGPSWTKLQALLTPWGQLGYVA